MTKRFPYHRTNFVFVVLLLLIAVGFIRARLHSRPGSEEFATTSHMLGKHTLGMLVDWRVPAEQYPDDQLEFWLAECERILAENPNDAELHTAAALMLDQPCSLYKTESAQRKLETMPLFQSYRFGNPFRQGLTSLEENFDRTGRDRSVEWAKIATELETEDPRWWRIRSILLFPSPRSHQEFVPRVDTWISTLDEARRFDPGNALYDLLEMYLIGNGVIEYQYYAGFHTGPVVADLDKWNRFVQLAKNVSQSSHLSLGEPATLGMVRLHELSNHPRFLALESVRHRTTAARASYLGTCATSLMLRMVDLEDEFPTACTRLELLGIAQTLNDFVTSESNPCGRLDLMSYSMKEFLWTQQAELEAKAGEVSETTTIRLERARRMKWAIKKSTSNSLQQQRAQANLFTGSIGSLAVTLLFPSFCVALLLAGLWWLLCRPLKLGSLSFLPSLVMGPAIVVSLYTFGICPMNVLSESVQRWTLTILIFTGIASVIAGIAFRMRLRFRYSIRGLLLTSTSIALVCGLAVNLGMGWHSIGLPLAVNPQLENCTVLVSTDLPFVDYKSNFSAGQTAYAVTLWHLLDGESCTLILYAFLLGILCLWSRDTLAMIEKLFVGTALSVLALIAVWIWLEPSNYVAQRAHQIPLETYIESIDMYYEPLQAEVERLLNEPMVGEF